MDDEELIQARAEIERLQALLREGIGEISRLRESEGLLREENKRLRMILDQACEEIDLLRRYLIAAMPPRAVMQTIRLHLDRPAPTAGYIMERARQEARQRWEPTIAEAMDAQADNPHPSNPQKEPTP